MEHILRLATTLALVLGIATFGFAVVNPNTKLKLVNTAEKQTTMRKHSKHRRGKRMGNRGRTSARPTHRLTERQRRDFNQRLRNIYIN
jgi:hypothetical protein